MPGGAEVPGILDLGTISPFESTFAIEVLPEALSLFLAAASASCF
jgi:hypothetical protein